MEIMIRKESVGRTASTESGTAIKEYTLLVAVETGSREEEERERRRIATKDKTAWIDMCSFFLPPRLYFM